MNFITTLNHLRSIAQRVITIQVRGHPAHPPRLRATASPLRIRLIIPTPTNTAEVHRLSLQVTQDMENRPPGLVRSMAITNRRNLLISPEMNITGHGTIGRGTTGQSTTTRTGGIPTMASTRKALGP